MLFQHNFNKKYPIIFRTTNLDISSDISVVEIGYNRVPAGLCQTMRRDVYIIHYIGSGKGVFLNERFCETDGYAVVPKELEIVTSDTENPYECYWIMFRGANAHEIMNMIRLKHNCVFSFKYNRECVELIKKALFYEDYSNEYEEAYTLQSVFYQIIAFHMKNTIEEDNMLPSIAQNVAKHIEKNYYSEISITELAKIFHVSRNYLYSLFKQEYGVSPQDYLISCRIKRAKRLLKNKQSQLYIKEISSAVGFDNPLYFSRIFHARTGMSPSEYRKKHKNP